MISNISLFSRLEQQLPDLTHEFSDIAARFLLLWLQGEQHSAISLVEKNIPFLPECEQDKLLELLAERQIFDNQNNLAKETLRRAASIAFADNRAIDALKYVTKMNSKEKHPENFTNMPEILQAASAEYSKSALEIEEEINILSFSNTMGNTIAHKKQSWDKISNEKSKRKAAKFIADNIFSMTYSGHYDPDHAIELFKIIEDYLPADNERMILETAIAEVSHCSIPDFSLFRRLIDRWWTKHAAQEVATIAPVSLAPRQAGPLRIGILDIAGFVYMENYYHTLLSSSFQALPKDRIQIYIYSLIEKEFPERAKKDAYQCIHLSENWREATQQITNNDLDVLIVPNGFIPQAPLNILAAHPARRLALWIHTYGTYGPILFDSTIMDVNSFTEFQNKITYETPIIGNRLPFLLGEPENSPPISEQPHGRNGFITFGVFNRTSKITDHMICLWRQILEHLPDARIAFANTYLSIPERKENLLCRLRDLGIPLHRVKILPFENNATLHLSQYSEIDISLDTFPFNGGVTTFESLWQGVPVISRASELPLARTGLAYLSMANMRDLVSFDDAGYITRAVELAQDIEKLKYLRHHMRHILKSSQLMNPDGYADFFEDMIYRILASPQHNRNGTIASSLSMNDT